MSNDSENIKNLLLCRTKEQAGYCIEQFKQLGFNVFLLPTIKIIPIEIKDFSVFNGCFDYIIFTSTNSVKIFFDVINNINVKFNNVICIGKKTEKTCSGYGLNNIFIPAKHSSEGIVESLNKMDLKGKQILIPGSKISKPKLKEELIKLGALVTFLPIYDNIIPEYDDIKEPLSILNKNKIDMYIFTSPSTFYNFLTIMKIKELKEFFDDKKIAAIGTATQKSIESTGLIVDVVPEIFNMENLVTAISQYYKK
ncbi:MAG: uroporphyrinogen-III synthase [bacterium]